MEIYGWGVDSAEIVTENLFRCVALNFGYPVFWGRYLVRVPAVSEGLSKQEIAWIRSKGVKLLPIYNNFREAKGYGQGIAAAEDAVNYAGLLGITKGTPLFANVENFFQVDDEWIQGWTEAVLAGGYHTGLYYDPVTGDFNEAFCRAAKENERVITQNILWSAQPEVQPSGPRNPPYYRPKAPDCGGNVWAWQYSRMITQCSIDFNLAAESLIHILW